MPLEQSTLAPPRTQPRPRKGKTQITPAVFRSSVFSLLRYFTVPILWKWDRDHYFIFFLLLNIASAIYHICEISHLRCTSFVVPLQKKTCFTKKCLSTSWGSPPHLFYPIFHWFNFWCIHTNVFLTNYLHIKLLN